MMNFATIVFTDIVSFSKQRAPEQKDLVNSFNDFVAQITNIHDDDTLLNKDIIALPTGDGMALAFMQSCGKTYTPQEIIEFCIQLHKWAYAKKIELRIGVHYGAVHLLRDINGQANICGDTINNTQRIMDGGGPAQLIFSADYYDQYIKQGMLEKWQPPCLFRINEKFPGNKIQKGKNDQQLKGKDPLEKESYRLEFSNEFDIIAKHSKIIPARQLFIFNNTKLQDEDLDLKDPSPKNTSKTTIDDLQALAPSFWSNRDPEGKLRMQLNLTRTPRTINNDFGERLHKAGEVALVLLTGENLLKKLESKQEVFGPQLRELWVFMPHEIGQSKSLNPEYNEKYFKDLQNRWLASLNRLNNKCRKASFRLGFFKEAPYFGASYLDWRQPGGRIHVSPYVWGTDTSINPAFDVEWVGKTIHPAYQAYRDGLLVLNAGTDNELEKQE